MDNMAVSYNTLLTLGALYALLFYLIYAGYNGSVLILLTGCCWVYLIYAVVGVIL